MSEPTTSQWAMVPEAAVRLTATDLKVFIVLSAKAAGLERIAWISQGTIAEKIGVERHAVGRAIRRLENQGFIRSKGTVTVDREIGTWVKKYLVAPFPATAERSDQPVGAVEVPSVSTSLVPVDPMEHLGGPDGTFGDPRWNPAVYHIHIPSSDPQVSNPLPRSVENEVQEPKSKELDEEERCPNCPNCIPAWHRQHVLEEEGA